MQGMPWTLASNTVPRVLIWAGLELGAEMLREQCTT